MNYVAQKKKKTVFNLIFILEQTVLVFKEKAGVDAVSLKKGKEKERGMLNF